MRALMAARGAYIDVEQPGRSTSTATLVLGLAAPGCAALGAFLANRGVLAPYQGFVVFLLALPLAALAVLVGLFALFRARGGRNRTAKRKATTGMAFALVTLAAVAGLAAPGANYPVINDITTDTDDPPQFVAALRENALRGDMPYPPEFAAEQRRAYPAVTSRVLPVPPDEAFKRVRTAVENLQNTRIVDASQSEGRIEAVATSRVFRFADDVVVRIRPVAEGSRVDIRSRSRDGRSDLGVNAQRIENILTVLH
jgi:uncharacterized protein (DUF1499 family)